MKLPINTSNNNTINTVYSVNEEPYTLQCMHVYQQNFGKTTNTESQVSY